MGPPIDHGAFLRPCTRLKAISVGRKARVFNVLSDFDTNRFEELNNYSGLMTRRKMRIQVRAGA
jgi:hypothetical protein